MPLPPSLSKAFSDKTMGVVKAYALKGLLLAPDVLEGLAEAKGLDDLVVRLRTTLYAEQVERLQPPYSPHALELAFRAHLVELHRSLIRVSPHPSFLEQYYLRHIALNLKTVLKAKALGKGYDEMASRIDLHAEELVGRREVVVRALAANTLDEAVELLGGTEFAEDARAALEAYKERGEARLFDLYIDHAYYSKLLTAFKDLKREGRWVRPLLELEVDGYNALALLRGKLWGLSPSELRGLVVEGFRLKREDLEGIIRADTLDEAVELLGGTEYRGLLPAYEGGDEFLAALEEAFLQEGYRVARRPFLWQIFTLGTILAAIKLKEVEVRNLASIAVGVGEGMGYSSIAPRLIGFRSGP